LESLYNRALQLVRTTLKRDTYYVASDNLLAQKAIAFCNAITSSAIGQSIRDYQLFT